MRLYDLLNCQGVTMSSAELPSARLQITPFRFVGSTVMMNRLRTASSPYLGGAEDGGSLTSQLSNSPEPADTIAAVGGDKGRAKGPLPLLPLDQKTPLVNSP